MAAVEAASKGSSGGTELSSLIDLSGKGGIWAVKGQFHLGAGQKDGLTYAALRDRMLGALDSKKWVLDKEDPKQESTVAQLDEEREKVGETVESNEPFPLDTTMTVVRNDSGDKSEISECILISPVPWNASLASEISSEAGEVVTIVCPNLQHWLYALEWKTKNPKAKIWVPPAAHGEDVGEKLAGAASEAAKATGTASVVSAADIAILTTNSESDGSRVAPSLQHRLLEGASLAMNEILFFHAESKTLIASDGAYTGYSGEADKRQQPTWFARLWFKLTKPSGSFRKPEMPIYRTMRVQSHGDPVALRRSVLGICSDWEFEQIVCAHGTVPHRGDADIGDARAVFKHLWFSGCGLDKLPAALVAGDDSADSGVGDGGGTS